MPRKLYMDQFLPKYYYFYNKLHPYTGYLKVGTFGII